jgi:hypothetical protein
MARMSFGQTSIPTFPLSFAITDSDQTAQGGGRMSRAPRATLTSFIDNECWDFVSAHYEDED